MGRFDNRNSGPRSGGFNRGFGSNFGPRKMHKAVCDECKQECEVPSNQLKESQFFAEIVTLRKSQNTNLAF